MENEDKHEFEETRRCLINSCNSSIQTHAGLLIAIAVGAFTLISVGKNIIAKGYWFYPSVTFLVLLFLGLVAVSAYVILRIVYWTMCSNSLSTVSMNETLWYFNKYNSSRPDACVLNAPYQVMLLTVMNHSLFQLKRDGKFRWYQTWALYTSGNKDPDEVLNNQNKISHSMQRDDLLWGLIESGHIAIFQWAAVWVASGIGLIQMIIEILRMQTLEYFSLGVFVFIYLVLISLMTFSIYNILKIMHLQNGWANQFPEELRTIFYASRSESSNRIVGNRNTMSTRERILIALHLIVFLVFLVIILVF